MAVENLAGALTPRSELSRRSGRHAEGNLSDNETLAVARTLPDIPMRGMPRPAPAVRRRH
jgi:hypothetical protein